MKPKIAIVTQSYRGDLKECKLLCESIDRFVDEEILHYIFVNDEDFHLFNESGFSPRHIIKKKSEILPSHWINIPYKLLGHKYYFSFCTIPVREWIIQQICKLGAFDVIDSDIEAIVNIDSETVFMKPFHISDIYNTEKSKFIFFKEPFKEEPCHEEYCKVAKKLCNLPQKESILRQYCYMSHPVVFVKENIDKLLATIRRGRMRGWKNILGNTYRFSEYYLYGLYTDYNLNLANHYEISYHLFPMIDIGRIKSELELEDAIRGIMSRSTSLGVWLQKSKRNSADTKYFDFEKVQDIIKKYWDSTYN